MVRLFARQYCAVSVLFGTLALAACDIDAPYSRNPLAASRITTSAEFQDTMEVEPTVDRAENRIAKLIPTYGGHFFDTDGALVIYLKDHKPGLFTRSAQVPVSTAS